MSWSTTVVAGACAFMQQEGDIDRHDAYMMRAICYLLVSACRQAPYLVVYIFVFIYYSGISKEASKQGRQRITCCNMYVLYAIYVLCPPAVRKPHSCKRPHSKHLRFSRQPLHTNLYRSAAPLCSNFRQFRQLPLFSASPARQRVLTDIQSFTLLTKTALEVQVDIVPPT
jgi:hypothetical protein